MSLSLDALEEAALGFANELRGVHGLQPADALLAGVPHSTCGCPIATTAGGWRNGTAGWEVAEDAIYVGPRGAVKLVHGKTPASVKEFMAAFDAGMFPHLSVEPIATVAVIAPGLRARLANMFTADAPPEFVPSALARHEAKRALRLMRNLEHASIYNPRLARRARSAMDGAKALIAHEHRTFKEAHA